MGRTPKKKPSSGGGTSYLNQLSTLRGYITAMGMKHTESQMSSALRSSGFSVELALERLLGEDAASSSASGALSSTSDAALSYGAASTYSSSATSSAAAVSSSGASASSKKRRNESTTPSKPKRAKYSSGTPAKSSQAPKNKYTHTTPKHTNNHATSSAAAPNRLLLCKRWTVAISKYRGRVSHGESCSFDENYRVAGDISHKMDPMVRFRTKNAEGTLNRYLCGVLGPLLHLPAGSAAAGASGGGATGANFIPMIHLSAKTLMEDSLIIGSEVPINLEVYLNDPIGFFGLFEQHASSSKSESSQFFGRNNKKGGGKMDAHEAAFRLLQWAERGEEVELAHEEAKNDEAGKKGVEIDLSEMKESKSGKTDDDSADSSTTKELVENEDYEETPEMNELNQLVATSSKPKPLPELPDPTGFKDGVVLRPYQRQALYWMCRREGLLNQLEDEGDEELELLAELAASTHSRGGVDGDIQIWSNGISCDCGPVVVPDEMACRAIPVIDFGKKEGKKYLHHPLWKRRFLATDNLDKVYAFYVNELLGIASASPPNPPRGCVGGILADAMGLGKTVMLMSLILQSKATETEGSKKSTPSDATTDVEVVDMTEASKKSTPSDATTDVEVVDVSSDDDDEKDEDYVEDKDGKEEESKPKAQSSPGSCGTTLVIAPLSLISQWEEEMASKTNLTAFVYYDNASKKIAKADSFSSVDVVVTTYGTIQSEYVSLSRASKNGGSREPGANQPLLSFGWKRVILDEAHGIKNPSTIVSKACCLVRAESRWCVTGTPIQNSLQDVYGLLKFLRHEPWCEASFWKNAITSAISDNSTGVIVNDGKMVQGSPMKGANANGANANGAEDVMSVAFGRVRRVLSPIIMRRTKDTLAEDGKPILSLPPIESSVVSVTLSLPEREFYNALLQRSQSVFEGYLKAGTAAKSWFAIFSLLQRLRQSCDHVSLTVQNRFDTFEMEDGNNQNGGSGDAQSAEGTISDKFLTELLSKFKKDTVGSQGNLESTSFVKEVAAGLTQSLESSDEYLKTECPICLDEPRIADAVHTPCAHMFCKGCLIGEFQEQQTRGKKGAPVNNKVESKGKVDGGECPVCHTWVKLAQVIQIKKSKSGEMSSVYLSEDQNEKENVPCMFGQKGEEAARETLESALMKGSSSSKLEAVLQELDNIWETSPRSKILIFSQFLGFLDIITRSLNRRNIMSYRIDGKMSLQERVKMIDKFNKDSQPTQNFTVEDDNSRQGSVFLVSMKAGGCGLNLVAASTVFIIDPWWNQAIEDQCINRIHRIGQQAKVVRVRKFVVENSVEEKIVKLQMKKKNMANDILDNTDSSGQFASTKPTLEDFKLIFGG